MTDIQNKNGGATKQSAFDRQWHHKPDVPIQISPFFSWPLQPMRMIKWVQARWFAIAENVILIGIAFAMWTWFQPSLETAKTLEFSWISEIYFRNFILLLIVAGGLHLYFFTFKKQDKELKFDGRDLAYESRNFVFKNQVFDNMFWSLGSGVFFWTSFEVLMFWAMANGYAPVLQFSENPIWFAALFFLTPVIISFHFYWIHRLIHWPPLYKACHALHHKNINVGPWSGLSMHPLEHLLFFSSVLVHFVLSAHPLHILFHMQHQALTAATSHTGYESLLVKDKKQLALGTFHHQMHHRYFDCNYGNLEVPWDKWFGSFHDGTEGSHEKFKERRKKLMEQG